MNQDMDFLKRFYPTDSLKIMDVSQKPDTVLIRLKSVTHSCKCPKCGMQTRKYHGMYERTVQDLPILGKGVMLQVHAHEYRCMNEDCDAVTIAEDFDGFLSSYSRMTERCADFVCALAVETSCEGCSRICRSMGIRISGDTVIRLLLKRYHTLEGVEAGDVIGVDDFAYKKRNTYGTVIVDEKTHSPITILDGRDGESLRAWLQNNKHVKVVTRDRASAYAKVIAEELPDAMQIADRFHLHQNLLEAIKKALNSSIPATVEIPHKENNKEEIYPCKKNRIGCG